MNSLPDGAYQVVSGDSGSKSYVDLTIEQYAWRYPDADLQAVETILRLGVTYFAFHAAFLSRLSQSGFSKAINRFTVLRILYFAESGRTSPGHLSKELNVTTANMTYLLDGLEKDGLILREAKEGDRRATVVVLTDEGRTLCKGLIPEVLDFFSKSCEVLTTEEKLFFNSILAKLETQFEKPSG